MHRWVTEFRRADEVTDPAHDAVVLSLRLVQFHSDPLTTCKLCGSTEPQSSSLTETEKG